jgi:hypothetical protein
VKTGTLVAVFVAVVFVAEINVFVGETVKVTAVALALDVVVADAVLVTVFIAVSVFVAVTTMGVSVEIGLTLVAVLDVASAWAVSMIMVGIRATSMVGIGAGALIPTVEQASVKSKADRQMSNMRFMNGSPSEQGNKFHYTPRNSPYFMPNFFVDLQVKLFYQRP